MQYVSLDDSKSFIFPYIYEQLSGEEPSAQYELESNGLAELDKVLHLVQSDTFYPTIADKAAYLLCSIAGSQYFSNGNKRLGVMVLTQFIILNKIKILILSRKEYQALLKRFFSRHTWESNSTIIENEPLFLYNLAIIIGDRNRWGQNITFDTLKKTIAELFSLLYQLP